MDQNRLAFKQIVWLLGKTTQDLRVDIDKCLREINGLYHVHDEASNKRSAELTVKFEGLKAGVRLLERADFVDRLNELGKLLQPGAESTTPRYLDETFESDPAWPKQTLEEEAVRQCWHRVNTLGLAILLGQKSGE